MWSDSTRPRAGIDAGPVSATQAMAHLALRWLESVRRLLLDAPTWLNAWEQVRCPLAARASWRAQRDARRQKGG